MKKLWYRIKHWYWWKFKATDREKAWWQAMVLGVGFLKGEEWIDAKNFYFED